MDNICHLSSKFFFVFEISKFDKIFLSMFHICHLGFKMHRNNKKPCSLQDSFNARDDTVPRKLLLSWWPIQFVFVHVFSYSKWKEVGHQELYIYMV